MPRPRRPVVVGEGKRVREAVEHGAHLEGGEARAANVERVGAVRGVDVRAHREAVGGVEPSRLHAALVARQVGAPHSAGVEGARLVVRQQRLSHKGIAVSGTRLSVVGFARGGEADIGVDERDATDAREQVVGVALARGAREVRAETGHADEEVDGDRPLRHDGGEEAVGGERLRRPRVDAREVGEHHPQDGEEAQPRQVGLRRGVACADLHAPDHPQRVEGGNAAVGSGGGGRGGG
eukprot:1765361-Prymnesium_polylepis.1